MAKLCYTNGHSSDLIAIGYWVKSPQAEKIREDEARRRDQEKRQQEQNRQK